MRKIAFVIPSLLAGTLIVAGCGAVPSMIPIIGEPWQPTAPEATPLLSTIEFEVSAASSTNVRYLMIILQPNGSPQITKTVSYTSQRVRFDSLPSGPIDVTVNALNAYKTTIGSATKTATVNAGTNTRIPLNIAISGSGRSVNVTVTIGTGTVSPVPSPSPSLNPTPAPISQPYPLPTPTSNPYPSSPPSTPAPIPSSPSSYGVKPGYSPAYDVLVAAGSLNQTLINSKPDGTRFAIAAGVHRLSSAIAPKSKQQFLGMPGAIINGSKVLSGWTQEGTHWYIGGQTQRLPVTQVSGYTINNPESPMANQAEDVFYDDRPLVQVDALSKLAAGKFYFDYSNNRIYLADNPNGHTVETTSTAQAFNGGGSGVLIKNLVVEKFGNRAQTGAIQNGGGSWTVEDCEVRFNHGVGVFLGDGGTVRGCKVHHQGQLGLAGPGSGNLVENTEIAYNNIEGYNSYWEAGGTKWAYSTNLTVRNNWAHDNYGPGLWTDIDNRNTLYEGNLVERNERSGIFHEISYDAVIRNNTLRNNGTNYKYWEVEGAGINLTRSQNVEIYGNTLEGNAAGIVLCHDARSNSDTKNDYIHDNTIKMSKGYTGIVLSGSSDNAVFSSKNNRFVNNTYQVSNTGGTFWRWNGNKTWSQWKAAGQDTSGSVSGL